MEISGELGYKYGSMGSKQLLFASILSTKTLLLFVCFENFSGVTLTLLTEFAELMN